LGKAGKAYNLICQLKACVGLGVSFQQVCADGEKRDKGDSEQIEDRYHFIADSQGIERRRYLTTSLSSRRILQSVGLCSCRFLRNFLQPCHLFPAHHGYLLLHSRNRRHFQGNRHQYNLVELCQFHGNSVYFRLLYCHFQ
jgi:hypothetical protein